jgi:acyl carrier protein
MDSTMDQLTEVFQNVFDDLDLHVDPSTTADQVEGWDSLSHINLIVAIEVRFNVSFSQKEVFGFKNVGDMANCINGKLVKK